VGRTCIGSGHRRTHLPHQSKRCPMYQSNRPTMERMVRVLVQGLALLVELLLQLTTHGGALFGHRGLLAEDVGDLSPRAAAGVHGSAHGRLA